MKSKNGHFRHCHDIMIYDLFCQEGRTEMFTDKTQRNNVYRNDLSEIPAFFINNRRDRRWLCSIW